MRCERGAEHAGGTEAPAGFVGIEPGRVLVIETPTMIGVHVLPEPLEVGGRGRERQRAASLEGAVDRLVGTSALDVVDRGDHLAVQSEHALMAAALGGVPRGNPRTVPTPIRRCGPMRRSRTFLPPGS